MKLYHPDRTLTRIECACARIGYPHRVRSPKKGCTIHDPYNEPETASRHPEKMWLVSNATGMYWKEFVVFALDVVEARAVACDILREDTSIDQIESVAVYQP
jgi:hypothetical protein